jgi:hypothetical protein
VSYQHSPERNPGNWVCCGTTLGIATFCPSRSNPVEITSFDLFSPFALESVRRVGYEPPVIASGHCCAPRMLVTGHRHHLKTSCYETNEDGVNLGLVDPSGRMWCGFLFAFLFLPQNLSLIKIVDLKFNKAPVLGMQNTSPGSSFSYTWGHCLLSSMIPRVRPIMSIHRAPTPTVKPWYVARMPMGTTGMICGRCNQGGAVTRTVDASRITPTLGTTGPFHVLPPVAAVSLLSP